MTKTERLLDLIATDIANGEASQEVEDAVNVAYDYIYQSIKSTLENNQELIK